MRYVAFAGMAVVGFLLSTGGWCLLSHGDLLGCVCLEAGATGWAMMLADAIHLTRKHG